MKATRTAPKPVPQKLDHQARILSAATQLFLESGYEETSTAEIASRAKVSKRELYSNFEDKRDILEAVITELQGQIQSQAGLSWSSSDDVRKVLTQAGTHILEFIYSERFAKLFRIVAAQSFHDPRSARKFYLLGPGAGRNDTAAFLRRQMQAGALRKADALRAADDFLDLVISARHLTAVVLGQDDEEVPTRAHVKRAVDIFLHYYGTPDQPGRSSNPTKTAVAARKQTKKKTTGSPAAR